MCFMYAIKRVALAGSLFATVMLLSACEKTPPDYRAPVTLPLYTEGDADNGALIYEEACGQCHQLTPGLNKKGPQLMNVYGAPAATLADYEYSDSLATSGWVWDAKTLDPYIADTEKVMPNSKMLADPMPDASARADVIAYLSTLRADIPATEALPTSEPADAPSTQMSNEPVEILEDAEHQPAASY